MSPHFFFQKQINVELPPESSNGIGKLSSPTLNDGPFRRPLMPSPHFKPPPRPGTADAFKAQLEVVLLSFLFLFKYTLPYVHSFKIKCCLIVVIASIFFSL